MRIQIANNELSIELNEQDLTLLSNKYSLQEQFQFSILDDESLLLSLRMEGSDKLCMMYEDNELILFLPFTEFEKWLNSGSNTYYSEKGDNASNNMHITIKKDVVVPKIKTYGPAERKEFGNPLSPDNFNLN
jgi:hypothetical protein